MLIKRILIHNYVILLALACFGMALWLHSNSTKPTIQISRQESALNIDRHFLRIFSLGNKRVLSNLMWIQTLMESDEEKYKGKDYSNWMYLRFLTISDLDPMFYENYLFGGMYLSIIKDDLMGAAQIYELGLAKYPDDYDLNYNAGFNYYYEIGDAKKGYQHLSKIQDHARFPRGLKYIVQKLRFETTHDYEDAIRFLTNTLENSKDEVLRRKLSNDLYSIFIQRDLDCLNGGGKDCQRTDPKGIAYVQDKSGTWVSTVNYRPYKIFRKHQTK